MLQKRLNILGGAMVCLSLAACGTTGSSSYPAAAVTSPSSPTVNVTSGYGVVQGVDMIPRQSANLGVGTLAGAVVGGVIGSQIGSGSGRTAATVAGVAGGALAGRAIQNSAQQNDQVYRLTLRMDDGTVQTLIQESQPSLRLGDRIRINNGVIERL